MSRGSFWGLERQVVKSKFAPMYLATCSCISGCCLTHVFCDLARRAAYNAGCMIKTLWETASGISLVGCNVGLEV
eukprot:5358112-Amphidinium_carterae.1